MIRIQLFSEKAQQIFKKLPSTFGRRLFAEVGGHLEYMVRRHFLQRNAKGNKKGWPSKDFWSREGAKNTALQEVTPRRAVVTIASAAIGHKIKGGTVRPKRGRMLAIPATAKAYVFGSPREGAWASGELFLVKPKSGTPFLATGKGDDIEPQYWLVPKVTHKPDPDTLPRPQVIRNRLGQVAHNYLETAIQEATA